MSIVEISGLIAYPSKPEEIGQTILRCLERINKLENFNDLNSWEENDIPGRFIDTEVLTKIESGSIFIADITRLNFNVVFEIGYAIGRKKRAFIIRNENIKPEMQLPQWMTIGLMRFGRGKKITLTDIEEMEGAGGTREPDPWVGPYR